MGEYKVSIRLRVTWCEHGRYPQRWSTQRADRRNRRHGGSNGRAPSTGTRQL